MTTPKYEFNLGIFEMARGGRWFEAIKLYRVLYCVPLKEAKDAVEAMVEDNWRKPIPVPMDDTEYNEIMQAQAIVESLK